MARPKKGASLGAKRKAAFHTTLVARGSMSTEPTALRRCRNIVPYGRAMCCEPMTLDQYGLWCPRCRRFS